MKGVKKSRRGAGGRLLLIQTLLCAVLLAMIAVIRLVGGEVYEQLRTLYWQGMNQTVIKDVPEAPPSETLAALPLVQPDEDSTEPLSQAVMLSASGGDYARLLLGTATAPLASGRLTSPFGTRNFRGEEFHHGVDIAQVLGTPIGAMYDGVVEKVGGGGSYGNYLILSHQNGIQTLYAHCHRVTVSVGDRVTAGDTVALVGNTGDSTGAHLHIELRVQGERCDPAAVLDMRLYD